MKTDNFQEPLPSSVIWPARQLSDAVHILARKAGFTSDSEALPPFPRDYDSPDDKFTGQWMDVLADHLKIEIISVESLYAELEEMLCCAGPAIIRLTNPDSPGFLAILKGGRQKITLITPDFKVCRVPADTIRNALTTTLERAAAEPVRQILEEAGIPEDRREDSEAAIVREQLSETRIRGCWLLRLSPGSDFLQQLRHARIPWHFATILGAHLMVQFLLVFSWWVIGEEALEGHFELAALNAWALLLLTIIPFRVLDKWAQNNISINVSTLFKQRLLNGILQLEPEEVRHQGAGQFFGTVMEADSFGTLAMEGGMVSGLAVIELFTALGVLAIGAGGILHALFFAGWIAFTAVICFRYYERAQKWIAGYREMTNDLVERMVGYRTRLIQEDPAHWHDEEDRIMKGYVELSERLDRMGIMIRGVVGRGWLLAGLPVVLFVFLTKSGTAETIAVSLGGVLLASQALTQFVAGVTSIINVLAAWKQVNPLFQAAARGHRKQPSVKHILPLTLDHAASFGEDPLIMARDITFRYREKGPPVLHLCTQQIDPGNRVLLEGPSGGGKSTLSAVLTGLRSPESGELLLWGIDREIIGDDVWRGRVVTAPQFHENHVLTETFGFNLLMGRGWPPSEEDITEASAICRELGLGSLLERMPSEFHQMVGQGGWQLSHGERSRLFIARALLQKADLIILDESFAALDPENLRRSLECVIERSPALLVIAHP
ncbi:ABC transporter ATP-binding protein [Desulfococcaceae bacterium HSG8]|nr:ABC transporter ATP-binding protein [Desulfococcaceae bacterium HSG8]